MKKKKNHVEKNSGLRVPKERMPNPAVKNSRHDIEDVPALKIPDANRHVDELIRKYNDFSIIERD